MRDTGKTTDRNDSNVPSDFVNYLPGMPRASNGPGRVERFLTRLFRRRGILGAAPRREE